MDPATRDEVIKRGLLGYRPFEALIEGIAIGEEPEVAIRKALRLLELPDSEASKLRTLLRLGEDLGVLKAEDGHLRLIGALESASIEEAGVLSPEDVESEAKARLFNARRLGRDAHNYLDETDRAVLAEALLKHESTRVGRSTPRGRRWRISCEKLQKIKVTALQQRSSTAPVSSRTCSR